MNLNLDDHRAELAKKTFASFGAERLGRLCHAVGLGDRARDVLSTFTSALAPWGERQIGAAPAWPSDIVDDHTPFELSVSVGGRRSEVRFLVEAQGETPTLRDQQTAARALTARLERELGADLARLRKVEDLFFPDDPQGIFAMWHAFSFGSDMKLDLKAYLNLQARGRALAPALAEDALARLGMARAWPGLSRIAARRGGDLDELLYFALDLSPSADSRVKVYFRHRNATASDLETAHAESPRYEAGQITDMCRALGGGLGPFSARAAVSCFSYVEGSAAQPSETTFYFPITGYVAHDREAKSRISAYLGGLGVPASQYEAAVEACAGRPLESGVGMQSYVSIRRDHGQHRLTVYFGPEAYRTLEPRTEPLVPPAARTQPTPEAIVRRHEAEPFTDHPVFRRLRREPSNRERLWKLMANHRVGLVDDVPRMLGSVLVRVDDDRIRAKLAKRLNDELGSGDFQQASKARLGTHIQALEPWRPSQDEAVVLAPGRALRREIERLCVEADPYEGVGATMVLGVFTRHVAGFLADELRRHGSIAPASQPWSIGHDASTNADDALALASLLGEGRPSDIALRGATATANALRAYGDALYEHCFA